MYGSQDPALLIYSSDEFLGQRCPEPGELTQNSCIAPIRLNDHVFYVTTNLKEALLHVVGKSEREISLWVDALCINQADNEEKSEQVRLMGEIYSRATGVIAWYVYSKISLSTTFCTQSPIRLALATS